MPNEFIHWIGGACRAFATTLYFLGDFETARQYAMRGIQVWRSGSVQSPVEELDAPAVLCLCYEAVLEWHAREIASCHATMAEAISLAKELSDMHALAEALCWAAVISYCERDPAEVERCASELIELSTRENFNWVIVGAVLRGWAHSASGETSEAILSIENGIRNFRARGTMFVVPLFLALKAEALHLADRNREALEAIREAEALAKRSEERCWSAELRRLRGVFLTAIDAEETQIEASFCEAIRIAREQKSISLEKRAEATYAEYRRQKASASGGRGLRLPLC